MQNKNVKDLIKESFQLKTQGFLKPAIEMLYKALETEENNPEILSQLAILYFELENFKRAEQYIDKVLELEPEHVCVLNLRKDIYVAQGELGKAKEIAAQIFKIQPSAQNLAEQIKIFNLLKDFDAVNSLDLKGLESPELAFELAKSYYAQKDFEKALALLKNASEHVEALTLAGKIYYETKDFENAETVFKKLEKQSPSATAYNFLGLLSLEKTNFSSAVKYFTKAVKKNSQNAEYNFNLGESYFLNGWREEAQKFFATAICLAPDNENYRFALAWALYKYGEFEKAKSEIKTLKNHHGAVVLSALLKIKKDDLLGAKKDLEKIIENDTTDAFAYHALAQVFIELKRFDEAKVALGKAIELRPKSLEYLCDLAEILMKLEKYEDAKQQLDAVLALNENYYPAYVLFAEIAVRENETQKLWDTAQDLIDLDSNSWEGYYYNALALFEQKDANFALESLKKAISLNVNNAMLYVKMSEFYQALGQNENALVYIKEAADIDKSAKNRELYQQLAAVVRHK